MSGLTPERLAEMRRIKDAATPGPWKTHLVDDTSIVSVAGVDVATTCDSSESEREDGYNVEYERMEADAAFIATFDPPTIDLLLTIAEREARTARERDELMGACERAEAALWALFYDGPHGGQITRPERTDNGRKVIEALRLAIAKVKGWKS